MVQSQVCGGGYWLCNCDAVLLYYSIMGPQRASEAGTAALQPPKFKRSICYTDYTYGIGNDYDNVCTTNTIWLQPPLQRQ